MSGYADYSDLDQICYHKMGIIVANKKNFTLYGNLVTDFDKEEVIITSWVTNGKRKLIPGVGGGSVSILR